MTITVRKAGEAMVKKAVNAAKPALASRASSSQQTPSSTDPIVKTEFPIEAVRDGFETVPEHMQKELDKPRHVSIEEAPYIKPAKTSTTTTLMPWNGWFERWIGTTFGQHRVDQINRTLKFMPDDIYDLMQTAIPNKEIPISKTDPTITHKWRYPSPGSQKPASIPRFEKDQDPYDSAYFKRDTKRRYMNEEIGNPDVERLKVEMMDSDDPDVAEEKEKLIAGRTSSPGNQGRFATGPTKFDPSGLRATMSVTWTALNESLDSHMPDHLPTPVWVGKENELLNWYEERGLPPPIGAYYDPLTTKRERRLARW